MDLLIHVTIFWYNSYLGLFGLVLIWVEEATGS